jgi:hypothetical protein
MNRLLWIFVLLSLITGCGLRLSKLTATQRGERLAIERGRLSDMTNPVGRTKSYITISHLLLSFASDALREQNTNDLSGLMDQYITTIRSARDTMILSDRDAERRPDGYKDLEIALRGQLRLLQDISRVLLAEQREPVDRAITVGTSVREEILRLLFPQGKPASCLALQLQARG